MSIDNLNPAGARTGFRAEFASKSEVANALGALAPLADPTFTGSVAVPDPTSDAEALNVRTAATMFSPYREQAPRCGLWLPGGSGSFVVTPDDDSLDMAGDAEWVFLVAAADWTPDANLVLASKRNADQGLAWQLAVTTPAGQVGLSIRTGATDRFNTALGVISGPTDGDGYWIRVRRTAASGAVQMHYAARQADEPTSWTAMTMSGAQHSGALDANTAPVEIGAYNAGTSAFHGLIERVIMRSAGTVVADADFSAPVNPRLRDAAGKIWTLTGSGWAWQVVHPF